MADVQVKFIPDTKEVDRELRRPRRQRLNLFGGIQRAATGAGGGETAGGDVAKTNAKGFTGMTKLLGGILGAVSVVAIVLSALQPILEPVLTLLKLILTILFIPLIPILKPVMQLLGSFAKALLPIMTKLSEGIGKLLSGEIGLGEFVEEYLLPVITDFGKLLLTIGWNILKKAITALAKSFFELGVKIGNWIFQNIIQPVADFITNIIQDAFSAIKDIGLWIWNQIIKPAFEFFKQIGMNIWNMFKDGLMLILQFGQWIWDKIIKPGLDFISNVGEMIWNFIKDGLNFISDLGRMIWNFIKDSLGGIFGGGRGNDTQRVEDAIITPGGRVITTNPRDYLIATQNPQNLNTGGSFNYSPTIQINGNINNEMDVRNIAMQIAEISKNELSRRTGRNLI